ncbi:MAG: glycosyltransferase family 2 protein [Candidatus Thorarchaeota archaeon]
MEFTIAFGIWTLGAVIFLICTLYYALELIPAYIRNRKQYQNPIILTDQQIGELLKKTEQELPIFKFQITTRGNEVEVVTRGIDSIYQIAQNPLFRKNIELLIVTDFQDEVVLFNQYLQNQGIDISVEVIAVPPDYQTPKDSLYKARSLHYSSEFRAADPGEKRAFVFYFDAESTISEDDFRRIIHSILVSPEKKIFEGPIVYSHKYFDANLISRQMEASRPFNCYHCAQVMTNPPPLHLHGSNLLVDAELVSSIGWDSGRLPNDDPLLAEDLYFGMRAYSRFGREVFGWHGGLVTEQPPFSVRESFNARMRWITGAWQALTLIRKNEEFLRLNWFARIRFLSRLRFRIIAHGISFFAALFIILTLLFVLVPSAFPFLAMDASFISPMLRTFQVTVSRLILLPGTLFWLFGIINGSSKNIRSLGLTKRQKTWEYIKLLLVTPIGGAVESFAALYATLRYWIGHPYRSWDVTRK